MAVADRTKGSTNGKQQAKSPGSRAEAAEMILTVLTDEPKSQAQVRRDLGLRVKPSGGSIDESINAGFRVLEAQHRAKLIPRAPGRRSGWVLYSSEHEPPEIPGEAIRFPYEWAVLPTNDMFIDPRYQRPLTTFVDKIRRNFNPLLFQTLVVNLRKEPSKEGKKYAVVDGQTRWRAAEQRGVKEVPCILSKHLSPEEEAEIFALLQKERRGMMSLHRFRAQVAAKNAESLAIQRIAKNAGWTIGAGTGELRAVAALEWCYRREPEENKGELLDRTLAVLADSWPEDRVPEDKHIRGLHYFFSHFPLGDRIHREVDDDKLVTRLRTTGVDGLERKAIAVKEHLGKGSYATLMAHAIQTVYGKR